MKSRGTPEPSSPIASLQKAAKRAKNGDDSEAALQAEGARLKSLLKADIDQQTFGRIPKAKGLNRLPGNDPCTQAAKFAQAARDLGADQDEDAFKGVVRKLSHAKPVSVIKTSK